MGVELESFHQSAHVVPFQRIITEPLQQVPLVKYPSYPVAQPSLVESIATDVRGKLYGLVTAVQVPLLFAVKSALTDSAVFMVTVQVSVPTHPLPLQPVKTESVAAVAVNVTAA
jgi:hypothetical protein